MTVFEYGDDIVIVDAGLMFPTEEMLGIDRLIPDFTYVLQNKERVRGIVITHGHEDHIGALPYLMRLVDAPIYARQLTARLISGNLKNNAGKKPEVTEVATGQVIKLGQFSIEMFAVCHSIPDAVGLIIETPIGTVVHTGDFKLDHTPVIGEPTDLHRLAVLRTKEVLLLLSDSTYVELPGYTPSEQTVAESLDRIVSAAPGRVIVATFSSLLARIQQVMDIAAKYKRKVLITGRSMENIVKIASDLGYLVVPPKTLSNYEQIHNLPHDHVVILTTGTQGEPTSALVRMANREHPQIRITAGDTVVMSATPIPGNEATVSKTIDNLFRFGADVVYGSASRVHVHGHGSQEELKTILNLVKPKFFVPVHGEYRHLARHARLATSMGVPAENAFVLNNGDVLELTETSGKVVSKVQADDIVANGAITGVLDLNMLRDRRLLSRDGVVIVGLTVSPDTGNLIGEPEILNKGFVNSGDNGELMTGAKKVVAAAVAQGKRPIKKRSTVEGRAKDALARYLYDKTHRRPMIIPLVNGLQS
jgi:ribonuclease J